MDTERLKEIERDTKNWIVAFSDQGAVTKEDFYALVTAIIANPDEAPDVNLSATLAVTHEIDGSLHRHNDHIPAYEITSPFTSDKNPEPVTPPPDDWIDWHGGVCPVPGALVDFELRDGERTETPEPANNLLWGHPAYKTCSSENDIIRYRVTPPDEVVEALRKAEYNAINWPNLDGYAGTLAAAVRELSWAMVPYGDREPTDTERYKRACKTARAVQEMNG